MRPGDWGFTAQIAPLIYHICKPSMIIILIKHHKGNDNNNLMMGLRLTKFR